MARVLPELSTKVSVKSTGSGKFAMSVDVTDAGDPVTNATASASGQHKRTNSRGIDKLTLHGSTRSRVNLTISVPGYQAVKERVKL